MSSNIRIASLLAIRSKHYTAVKETRLGSIVSVLQERWPVTILIGGGIQAIAGNLWRVPSWCLEFSVEIRVWNEFLGGFRDGIARERIALFLQELVHSSSHCLIQLTVCSKPSSSSSSTSSNHFKIPSIFSRSSVVFVV